MAESCVLCCSLCVFFIIIFNINIVLSKSDFYAYSAKNGNSNWKSDFQLLDDHQIAKRDTQNNQSNKPNNQTNDSNRTSFSSNKTEIVAANKTLIDQKITPTKTKLTKTVKVTTPQPVTTLQFEINLEGDAKHNSTNATSLRPVLLDNHNQTSPPYEEEKFPLDEESAPFNKTLSQHNITITKMDNSLYYNSTFSSDPTLVEKYWIDLRNRSDAKTNEHLANSHRRAHTVKLSFEFPFYGHLIKNVTIATGGFLYTGDYVHSWLAATQYIAPLMANFDTSILNDSSIRYYDNGTAFTVEWNKVALHDRPKDGEFTFQTTLHKNGDIVFVYKHIPLFIKEIDDTQHPVKVGLSDAYIIDRTIFFVRRKTIYEYHRVNFSRADVTNMTTVYLTSLPTCLKNTDCGSCTTQKLTGFQCSWCDAIQRCSSGVDRNRQEWLAKGCETKKIFDEGKCAISRNETNIGGETKQERMEDANYGAKMGRDTPQVNMGVSSIMAILFLIAMVSGLTVWILYAYRNPHTTSGQMLIRYRPSQWRWRRGEARYTAATIHM